MAGKVAKLSESLVFLPYLSNLSASQSGASAVIALILLETRAHLNVFGLGHGVRYGRQPVVNEIRE
jgi:hypothetical protein